MKLSFSGVAAKNAHKPVPIDHRGAQILHVSASDADVPFVLYPENTLAAIRKSFEEGRDVELDVNHNGETYQSPVLGRKIPYLPVFHDDHMGIPFEITNNDGDTWLRNMKTETIQAAVLNQDKLIGRAVEPRFKDDSRFSPGNPDKLVALQVKDPDALRIPALDEVLYLLKQYPQCHLYIELKTRTLGNQESVKGMDRAVVELVKDMGVEDQATIIGFNRFLLKKVRETADKMGLKDLQIAWDIDPTRYKTVQEILDYAGKIGANGILPCYEQALSLKGLVEKAQNAGLKVFAWVWKETRLEEISRFKQLEDLGVDGIVSNVPHDLQHFLADKPVKSN